MKPQTNHNNGVVKGAVLMFAVYTLFLLTFVIYILKNHEIIPF